VGSKDNYILFSCDWKRGGGFPTPYLQFLDPGVPEIGGLSLPPCTQGHASFIHMLQLLKPNRLNWLKQSLKCHCYTLSEELCSITAKICEFAAFRKSSAALLQRYGNLRHSFIITGIFRWYSPVSSVTLARKSDNLFLWWAYATTYYLSIVLS
jgi:hypothetical protein